MGGMTLYMEPLWLTLKLAAVTTGVLLVIGIPLAWRLARSRSRWKEAVDAVVALPLVLPPTVLGFYLLIALGPEGIIGKPLEAAGVGSLAFTFTGLVIGSAVYSLPFMVKPLQAAFESLSEETLDAAATLGASPVDRFFSVALPLSRAGLVTAVGQTFAHTIGEFGVALMIGGAIPGKTLVISIAVYNHVETLEYAVAHALSAGLIVFSFALLFLLSRMNRRREPSRAV
jgi:molybdate transport system permease protein